MVASFLHFSVFGFLRLRAFECSPTAETQRRTVCLLPSAIPRTHVHLKVDATLVFPIPTLARRSEPIANSEALLFKPLGVRHL